MLLINQLVWKCALVVEGVFAIGLCSMQSTIIGTQVVWNAIAARRHLENLDLPVSQKVEWSFVKTTISECLDQGALARLAGKTSQQLNWWWEFRGMYTTSNVSPVSHAIINWIRAKGLASLMAVCSVNRITRRYCGVTLKFQPDQLTRYGQYNKLDQFAPKIRYPHPTSDKRKKKKLKRKVQIERTKKKWQRKNFTKGFTLLFLLSVFLSF